MGDTLRAKKRAIRSDGGGSEQSDRMVGAPNNVNALALVLSARGSHQRGQERCDVT